jgi:hypothetical protein
MSRLANILTVTPSLQGSGSNLNTDYVQTITGTSAGTALTLSKYSIFVFNCEGTNSAPNAGVNVCFYDSASSAVTPTANYYFIPYAQQVTLDMGSACDTINFYNPGSGSATVYLKVLSIN